MVSVNDSYAGDHLKCADLKGREVTLTIASAALEKVGDDIKIVARFQGTDRDLVLNKTNAGCIAEMYGDESDLWTGKKITLLPTQTEYQGKIVPAIRVKLMAPANGGTPVQQDVVAQAKEAFPGATVVNEPPMATEDNFDDSIPF